MSVPYLGDFDEDATVYMPFNTFTSDDPQASATITNLADADIKVHKDGSVTQIVTDGATIAIDFDSVTGNHLATIDTSAHADYSTGSDYLVRIEGTTVDGGTVNGFIGHFSIQNRHSAGALRPTTAGRTLDVTATGAAGIDWGNVENASTAVDLSGTDIQLADTVTTLTGHTAQTGDSFARLGAPIAASISADIAVVDANVDAVLVDTGTTLDTKLNDIQGATFSSVTDSLEAVRDRGDAAWTTGAGGSDRLLLADTTIATLSTQTSFTLTAGSTDDDAYNNCTIVIEDVSTATQKAVGVVLDYTGSTKTVTLKEALAFTIATTDKVYILAENALKSTVANRQLDVTATGGAGIDWANVENPTSTVDLSATDIQLADTTTTLTNKTGFSLASTGLDAITQAATGMVEIAKGVWDRVLSKANHDIAQSAGKRLRQIDAAFEVHSGTAQTGTANTITLDAGASASNDIYRGDRIVIVAGTGMQEHGICISYNGTTKVATMSENWVVTPDNTSDFEIVPADVDVETWQHIVVSVSASGLPDVNVNEVGDTSQTAGDLAALLATAQADLDIITGVSGVNLLTATQASIDAIEADTNELQSDDVPTLISNLDAVVDTVKAETVLILADTADMQPKLGTPAGADMSADIAAVKADTAAILIDTNELQGDWTNGGRLDLIIDAILDDTGTSGVVLTAAERNSIADAMLDRDMSTGTDSGSTTVRTVRQALRSNRNKVSISGGTMTVTKEDDATTSWTAAITTASGDPISAIDPAGP